MSADGFMRRLITVFGEPITDNPTAFVAEYLDALKGFSAEVLADAAGDVIRNHAGPQRWPRIKTCVDACVKAAERQGRARPTPQELREGSAEHWARGSELAKRAITPGMAKMAWEQGWFAGLWDFVVAKHRLPEAKDIPRIRARSVENGRVMRETVAKPDATRLFGPALAKLGAIMLAKHEERYRKIMERAA